MPSAPEDLIAQLASGVAVRRDVFAARFLEAQKDLDEQRLLEAVAPGEKEDRAAFKAAFHHAKKKGFLRLLCYACLKSRITDSTFLKAAQEATNDPRLAKFAQVVVDLQAIADPAEPFLNPMLIGAGLMRATQQTCRVEVDGVSRGTAFLVAPDVLLTACHVICTLIGPDGKAKQDSAKRLSFVFQDYLDEVDDHTARQPGLRVKAHDDWLILAEGDPCEGAGGQLAIDPANLADNRDFAFIRLEGAPSAAAKGFQPADGNLVAQEKIFLFQHPQNAAMAYADGPVRIVDAASQRFGHDVNTLEGSSGGPCLNRSFQLVGIHQGELEAGNASFQGSRNIAISTSQILIDFKKLKASAAGLVSPLEVLNANGEVVPLLGRKNTQQLIWASVQQDRPRIIVVTGPQGRGKTFTANMLRALLPPDDHVILSLLAAEIQSDTPAEIAARILAFDAQPYDLPQAQQANTTLTAWLRYTFVPEFLQKLDQKRGGKKVWIVIDELDEVSFPGQSGLNSFLDFLYAAVEHSTWLRFVLLGYQGNAAITLGPLAGQEQLGPISADDVLDYIARRRLDRGQEPMGDDQINNVRNLIQAVLAGAGDPESAGFSENVVKSTILIEKTLTAQSG